MPTLQDVQNWRGRDVVGPDGSKIGSIEDIYLDRDTEQPEWVAVKTGLFGSKVSFAPIDAADMSGDEIRLPFDKDKVKDAPKVDADGELSDSEERELYSYYGRDWGSSDATPGTTGYRGTSELADVDASDRGRDFDATGRDSSSEGRGTVGRDVSGPETDDAMTRSEEELRVGTASRETGRARLRKWIETEPVNETVTTRREEPRVEREPITDANAGAAMSGGDLTEEEHEVTLRSEEAVVDKRVVPKERVRLDKDTVAEEQTVTDEVRKERIEADDDTSRR